MTYKELLKDLQAKKYQPLYLLHGDESYFIDELTHHFEQKVLSEGEKAFNYTVMYGKDADARSLMDTAARYPMMAPYQLIILKEAQDMKTLKDLKPYCEKPVKTTILVVCHKHKKLDMRTSFGKTLKSKAVVFESKKVYDNQIGAWIESYLQTKQLRVEPNATDLMAEYLGTNLSKVANELDKLAINLPQGSLITNQVVQDNIGISKDYNVFELQDALATKNVLKANRIVNYFIANPKKNPLVVVIGTLGNFFTKVYMTYSFANARDGELAKALGIHVRNDYAAAFRVKKFRLAIRNYSRQQTEQAIHTLKDFDLRSKGVQRDSTPDGELLKEMVWRIMH